MRTNDLKPEPRGETFAETLDVALYEAGRGSVLELADLLAPHTDLQPSQIKKHLEIWRNELRAGQTFGLALLVAAAVPELSDAVARKANLLLVDVPCGSPDYAANELELSGSIMGETATLLREVARSMADGELDEKERGRILLQLEKTMKSACRLKDFVERTA